MHDLFGKVLNKIIEIQNIPSFKYCYVPRFGNNLFQNNHGYICIVYGCNQHVSCQEYKIFISQGTGSNEYIDEYLKKLSVIISNLLTQIVDFKSIRKDRQPQVMHFVKEISDCLGVAKYIEYYYCYIVVENIYFLKYIGNIDADIMNTECMYYNVLSHTGSIDINMFNNLFVESKDKYSEFQQKIFIYCHNCNILSILFDKFQAL